MTDTDREDLDALLASKGWALLADRVRAECRARKDQGVRAAADETNDIASLNKLRQVLAFEMGVEFVLMQPLEMLQRHDRGGRSLMATPSRRGAL